MITPLPGAIAQKPGSATLPYFGVAPVLVLNDGKTLEGAADGNLCIAHSLPGQVPTLYCDPERLIHTHSPNLKGLYLLGPACRPDAHGSSWTHARVAHPTHR